MRDYVTICVRVTTAQLDEFENLLDDLELGREIVDWREEGCELG